MSNYRAYSQFPAVNRRTSSLSFRLMALKIGRLVNSMVLKLLDRSFCQISKKVSYYACFFSLKVVHFVHRFVRRLLLTPPADSADISFVYSLPYGLQMPQITARYLSSSTKDSILSLFRITEQNRNFQPLLGEL